MSRLWRLTLYWVMVQKPVLSKILTASCDHKPLHLSTKPALIRTQLKHWTFVPDIVFYEHFGIWKYGENKGWLWKESYEPIHEIKPIVAAAKNDLLVQLNLHFGESRVIDKLILSLQKKHSSLERRCSRILTCISKGCFHIHKRELPTSNQWTYVTVWLNIK